MKPGLPPLAAMRPDVEKTVKGTADFADWLQIKGVLAHAGLPEWETADFADWSRLGAGYRRQDCQNEKAQMFRRFARKTFGNTDLGRLRAYWRTPINC